MKTSFEEVGERLQRSYENICNLEREITGFFQASKYPILSDNNQQVIPEAIEYHKNRLIPLRFSVLCGEIIHHLRSCVDHLVWHLSDPDYRASNENFIEFPILKERPSQQQMFGRYERKIGGIGNVRILREIERLQPYNCETPIESPLFIIHNLDRIDKHRSLLLIASTGALEFPTDLFHRWVNYETGVSGSLPVDIASEFKRNGKIVPQIEISNFYGVESETAVQGLMQLHNYVIALVAAFEKLSA